MKIEADELRERLKVEALKVQSIILKELKYKSHLKKLYTWEGILNRAFPDLRISPEINLMRQLAGKKPDDSLSPMKWLAKFCKNNDIECHDTDLTGRYHLEKRNAISLLNLVYDKIKDYYGASAFVREPSVVMISQSLHRQMTEELMASYSYSYHSQGKLMFMNCRVVFGVNMEEEEIFVA